MQLRAYQHDIINDVRQQMRQGIRRNLIVAPTGSGKTILTAHMLGQAARKNKRSFFIVHRRELIKQSSEKFAEAGIPHAICAAGFERDTTQPIQIASIGSLSRRLRHYAEPHLVIWDECHHVAAKSWSKIFSHYNLSYHIGLTATPQRLDGKGLGDYFDHITSGPSVSELIDQGYLSSYKLYAPAQLNLSGLRSAMGDYKRSDLNELMDKPTITGDVIREYRKVADGTRAIVFCCGIKHSLSVVNKFRSSGYRAAHIDGKTSHLERDDLINKFRRREIQILSNVDIFSEGFDVPDLETVIMLRPTKSLSLYMQQAGRSLRPAPGKSHAVILDHAGNVQHHGLPDQPREWSLDGLTNRPTGSSAAHTVKICDQCFAAQLPGRSTCAYCDHQFPIKNRKIEHVDGDLEEINSIKMQQEKRREQTSARTLEELTELGRKRGYKRPHFWAKSVFQARQRKKLGY